MHKLLTFIAALSFIIITHSLISFSAPRTLRNHANLVRVEPDSINHNDSSLTLRRAVPLLVQIDSVQKDSLDSIFVAIPFYGHPIYYHKSLSCPKLKSLPSSNKIKIWDLRHAQRKYKPCKECVTNNPLKYPSIILK